MLNWGMGHATRSAAIIKKLQHQDNEIVIASDSDSLSFLKSNFPDCKHIELPPYHIKYPDRWPFWISFLSQLPKINRAIVAEKKQIQKIIAA
ncbi:MAG: hypothetical protein KA797_04460, partial [Chitinophagales bacterium]|nr:hypothetical protein [Chitinophagales bacterium]